MKQRIFALLLSLILTIGLTQAVFAIEKKDLTKKNAIKKTTILDTEAADSMEAKPQKILPTKKPVDTTKTNEKKSQIVKKIVVPEVVNYLGNQIPKQLVSQYDGTALKDTVENVTATLNKMVTEGQITNTKVEEGLREIFSTAVTDTGTFASGLTTKYNLQNLINIASTDPKNLKEVQKSIENEVKAYAEQELNKLANQALAGAFPIFEGVQIDFTNLNKNTLKATLRSAIVNALAQSYLGPEYAVVYMAVATVCPSCMVKMHAELRRFDKNYIRPATEKIGEEWDRFADRVSAESQRVGKQISAEIDRLKKQLGAELNRQKEDIQNEANRAKQRFNEEFDRAKNSKVGKEVERQLSDVASETDRVINNAQDEIKREAEDVVKEANRIGKRAGKEIEREAEQAKNTIKKAGAAVKNELKSEKTRISKEAQRLKDKVQEELQRTANKAKKELKRLKKKLRL